MATSIIWELVELKLAEFLWANDVDQAKDRQKPSSKQTNTQVRHSIGTYFLFRF